MLSKNAVVMLSIAAMAASASPVMAGTKVWSRLVPWTDQYDPSDPTLKKNDSYVKFVDRGYLLARLTDVTDATGKPAATSSTFTDSLRTGNPTLDGSEYMVIVKVHALGHMDMLGNPGIDAEIVVPVDLAGGKGFTKLDTKDLFAFLVTGLPQQIGVNGVEVWGPLGAGNVANCQAIVSGATVPAYLTTPDDPACRGGTQIGIGGLAILTKAFGTAGTRVYSNLVPWTDAVVPPNPTLSPKSRFRLRDDGALLAYLKGVTDGAGALVTTSTVLKDSLRAQAPTLDGSEYIVIIKVHALGSTEGVDAEIFVPVDLWEGRGATRLDLRKLFPLIAGLPQQIGSNGAEVWGPLGAANVAACQAIITRDASDSMPSFVALAGDPSCRGGTQIGIGGLAVPTPIPTH